MPQGDPGRLLGRGAGSRGPWQLAYRRLRSNPWTISSGSIWLPLLIIGLGELLPNLLPTTIVLATLNVVNAILLESALFFLGACSARPLR